MVLALDPILISKVLCKQQHTSLINVIKAWPRHVLFDLSRRSRGLGDRRVQYVALAPHSWHVVSSLVSLQTHRHESTASKTNHASSNSCNLYITLVLLTCESSCFVQYFLCGSVFCHFLCMHIRVQHGQTAWWRGLEFWPKLVTKTAIIEDNDQTVKSKNVTQLLLLALKHFPPFPTLR